MSDYQDILAEIKKIKTNVPVWVPSSNQVIDLKVFTLAQQKSIVETAADTSLSVLFFNATIYKILEQNLPQKTFNFNTVDRVQFTLALRQQVKDEIIIEGKGYSLKEILQRNQDKHPFKLQPKIIESTNYKFHVNAPNLEYDNKVNQFLLRKYKDETIRGSKLKALISDLYSSEIFKFISKVDLQSSGKSIDITTDIGEGTELIESIDGKEFVAVIEYINELRAIEKQYTKVGDINAYIDIVPDFFVV